MESLRAKSSRIPPHETGSRMPVTVITSDPLLGVLVRHVTPPETQTASFLT